MLNMHILLTWQFFRGQASIFKSIKVDVKHGGHFPWGNSKDCHKFFFFKLKIKKEGCFPFSVNMFLFCYRSFIK